ncbi:MAG: hypothetical protein J7L38_08185 [Thermoproteales archaeon]|nr:hypothetical protein [Thermoproteales archaeon]
MGVKTLKKKNYAKKRLFHINIHGQSIKDMSYNAVVLIEEILEKMKYLMRENISIGFDPVAIGLFEEFTPETWREFRGILNNQYGKNFTMSFSFNPFWDLYFSLGRDIVSTVIDVNLSFFFEKFLDEIRRVENILLTVGATSNTQFQELTSIIALNIEKMKKEYDVSGDFNKIILSFLQQHYSGGKPCGQVFPDLHVKNIYPLFYTVYLDLDDFPTSVLKEILEKYESVYSVIYLSDDERKLEKQVHKLDFLLEVLPSLNIVHPSSLISNADFRAKGANPAIDLLNLNGVKVVSSVPVDYVAWLNGFIDKGQSKNFFFMVVKKGGDRTHLRILSSAWKVLLNYMRIEVARRINEEILNILSKDVHGAESHEFLKKLIKSNVKILLDPRLDSLNVKMDFWKKTCLQAFRLACLEAFNLKFSQPVLIEDENVQKYIEITVKALQTLINYYTKIGRKTDAGRIASIYKTVLLNFCKNDFWKKVVEKYDFDWKSLAHYLASKISRNGGNVDSYLTRSISEDHYLVALDFYSVGLGVPVSQLHPLDVNSMLLPMFFHQYFDFQRYNYFYERFFKQELFKSINPYGLPKTLPERVSLLSPLKLG